MFNLEGRDFIMDVRDVTQGAAKVAQDTSARPQKPRAESAEKVETVAKQPVKGEGTVVEISTKSDEVVEKGNAKEVQEKKVVSEETPKAPQGDSKRLAYSLDEGNLVVSVIDTKKGEVVKEIPAEDERRIRQAINKFAENTEKAGVAQNTAKGIDVTS